MKLIAQKHRLAAAAIAVTALTALGASAALAASPATQPSPIMRSVLDQMRYRSPRVAQMAHPQLNSDPIAPLAAQMQDVVNDLDVEQTDAPVQTEQKQVVAGFDALIAEIEKEQKAAGNGGGSPNPTTPMSKSVLAGGPGGSGPLHDPAAGTRVWGQLPPKEREQILQSQTEGFPPGYESVLGGYYSRLAQQESAGDAAGPATQPVNP
jgi:hypothetical protein